jgi:hypothetical protein
MSYGVPPGGFGQGPYNPVVEIPPEHSVIPVREPKPYKFPAFYSTGPSIFNPQPQNNVSTT